jgi:hypothetical protein
MTPLVCETILQRSQMLFLLLAEIIWIPVKLKLGRQIRFGRFLFGDKSSVDVESDQYGK